MKKRLAAILGGITLALEAGCSTFGIRTVEQARYRVLSKEGKFEVRQYPDAIVAETVVDADYRAAQNIAFRRLAGYIFGKNKTRQQIPMTAPVIQEKASERIAMTAPVLQERSQHGWRMMFVLPAEYTLQTLPEPLDPDVFIRQQKGRKVAVLRYSGSLSEAAMNAHVDDLARWLAQKGLKATSEPRLAGYDPPWTLPFLRRNEIHVDIE